MSIGRQTPVILTGMHRSGTSLLARFVHHSGIDLGSELLAASDSNPYGHFEDKSILNFHKSILEREYGHTMWVPDSPRTTNRDQRRAQALLVIRTKKERWGWKEPRTALFLNFWNELLPQAHYLFVVRHPELVLDSLARRTQSKWYRFARHNQFLHGWLLYNRCCYDFYIQNRERALLVTLEQILRAPESFVERLSRMLGVSLSVETFRSVYNRAVLTRRPTGIWLCWTPLYRRCLSQYHALKTAADV